MNAPRFLRAAFAAICSATLLLAQQQAIEPVRPMAPIAVRPYMAPKVPPIRTQNSPRLRQMVRAGILYLSAHDAVALALENNIDIEVARYNPILSEWQLERSEAGGALPGVPSGASQVGSVASGQGVAGSQAAAGVTTGFAGVSNGTANSQTITEIGPIAQTLDPILQESTVASHVTTPEQDTVQSVNPILLQNERVSSASYSQGFVVGGNVTVTYKDSYLNENAPTDVLNPSSAPSLSLAWQQNLLRGFGIAVNERTIRVSRLNVQASELNFKTQVINTVATVLNTYYGLVADYEDLRAKREAVESAQRLVNDNQVKFRNGVMSSLDVTTAQAQLASTQSDLTVSETTLRLQELQLKNLLSRNGVADPVVAEAQIIPTDHIEVPQESTAPPLAQLVRTALANRPDLAAERLGVTSSQLSALGTINGVLPSLQTTATESDAGLAGVPKVVQNKKGTETADPFFIGNIGTAVTQLLDRNFPTNRLATFFQVPIRNRQAQADEAIDQLSLRQQQIGLNKDLNQVTVAVSNYSVALRQAQARYRAAAQNRILEQQLLDATQKQLAAGLSTVSAVIQQQRDLETAQSTEIAAMVSYSNARVAMDQTLGTILAVNHVSLDEARTGAVSQPPAPSPKPDSF